MKTLLGSMNFLVPGLPAVARRSLFNSIRWDDLEERVRLEEEEIFIVSCDFVGGLRWCLEYCKSFS